MVSVLPSVKWGDYAPEYTTQKHVMFFHLQDKKERWLLVVLSRGLWMDLETVGNLLPTKIPG